LRLGSWLVVQTGGQLKVRNIPLDQILDPETPVRTVASEEAMEDLISSIEQFGLLEPIVVVQEGEMYRLVAGHRRLIAVRALGRKKVPSNVLNVDAQTGALISLEENIKRENVNPYDEALYFLHLIKTHGMTQTEIANKFNMSKQQVHIRMQLLQLDPTTTEFVQKQELSMTHAVELGRIGDPAVRANIRAEVMASELSTLATRHLVDQVLALGPEVFEEGEVVIPEDVLRPPETTHYKCSFCDQPGSKVKLSTLFVCGFCLEALAEGAREAEGGRPEEV